MWAIWNQRLARALSASLSVFSGLKSSLSDPTCLPPPYHQKLHHQNPSIFSSKVFNDFINGVLLPFSCYSGSLSIIEQFHSCFICFWSLLFFFFGVAWFEQKLFVGDVSCDVCEANESSDGEKGEDWSENCLSSDEYTSWQCSRYGEEEAFESSSCRSSFSSYWLHACPLRYLLCSSWVRLLLIPLCHDLWLF